MKRRTVMMTMLVASAVIVCLGTVPLLYIGVQFLAGNMLDMSVATQDIFGCGFILAAIILIGCIVFLLRRTLRIMRFNMGECPRCGYNLRGDFDPGCPECGWGRDDERADVNG